MERTEIKIEFSIYHDEVLDHHEITKIIGIVPTFTCKKGDQIRTDLFRKESVWLYATEYIVSLHVDSILDKLIQILEPVVLPLGEYIRVNNLSSKFDIILRIANKQSPSHGLSNRFIHLCYNLNAVVHTDIYVF